MGKQEQPRRRGRSKEKGKREEPRSTTTETKKNGVLHFHAPLIQRNEESCTWYEYGKDLPERNDTVSSLSDKERRLVTSEMIYKYRSMADSIYQNELRLVNQTQSKESSADERWVENTMRKGTLKDRIAAMSVTLSRDPLHKFYALDGLLSMVGCSSDSSNGGGKPNSRVAQLTAEALEDLFVNTLLPPDRKLLTLGQRPLFRYENSNAEVVGNQSESDNKKRKRSCNKTLSPKILLLWRFEEMVKDKYDLYLRQYMAQTLQDGVEQQKIVTLRSAANLLSSVPEGEAKLLGMMVNKLGDPDKKTAAAAGHHLRIVLQRHPNMLTVIAREVQQLAHRPHLAPKALYNCIVFLNQLQLKRPELEQGVIEHDEKHFNRQSVGKSSSLPASLINTYFRLFEIAVQQNDKSSRKMNAVSGEAGSMKSRLLSALLTGVNRAHPYLPEKDQDMEEHVDALYRIVHTAPPGASTQALMLLFHLAVGYETERGHDDEHGDNSNKQQGKALEETEESKKRQDRFYRALYATLAKNDIVSRGKHLTMYFNLLYKAMKYDTETMRVHTFAKRLLAAVMHAPPPAMAASIFLLQEISKTHESLHHAWENVPDPESNASLVLDDTKREPKVGIVDMLDRNDGGQIVGNDASKEIRGTPPCWEISLFANHFHPSVVKFATDIGAIDYAGDPLHDFGLAPFLDKFAYRNPKSREKLLRQHQDGGLTAAASLNRRMKNLYTRLELPVNDPSFLERSEVGEQEEFFHRFFMERARRDDLKGIKRHSSTEDEHSRVVQEDDEDGWDEAQEQVLGAAEEADADVGNKTFEDYEAMWETDDEEEAFVDKLAMQLMEDAAGDPADIDDDGEMEDWEDLYTDDKGDTDKEDNSSPDDDSDADKVGEDDDVDAFMEVADSSDEAEYSDQESVGRGDVQGVHQEEHEGEIVTHENEEGSCESVAEDSEEDNFMMSLVEDDSEEEENEQMDVRRKGKQGKKQMTNSLPTFVDADEYAKQNEKSYTIEKKRSTPSAHEVDCLRNKSHKKSQKRIKR